MDYWVQYENIFSIVWLRAHVNEKSYLKEFFENTSFFQSLFVQVHLYHFFFNLCSMNKRCVKGNNLKKECNSTVVKDEGSKDFYNIWYLCLSHNWADGRLKKKSSCRLLSLKTWSPGTSVRRRGAVTLISRITDIYIQKYEFLLVCESSLDHQMLRYSLTLTAHQFHERFRNCLSISVRPGLSTCNCLFLFDLSILVWPVSQHFKFSYY